ncbi:MAG: FG-GAP repeat protein, partial [Planctomycetota bacterium]
MDFGAWALYFASAAQTRVRLMRQVALLWCLLAFPSSLLAQCELAKLNASDGASQDRFAWSVSVAGDVVVAGSWLHDDVGADSGSAYVYRNQGGAWQEEQKLTASDAAPEDHFGFSVATTGEVIVVGSFRDDDAGNASGSA